MDGWAAMYRAKLVRTVVKTSFSFPKASAMLENVKELWFYLRLRALNSIVLQVQENILSHVHLAASMVIKPVVHLVEC